MWDWRRPEPEHTPHRGQATCTHACTHTCTQTHTLKRTCTYSQANRETKRHHQCPHPRPGAETDSPANTNTETEAEALSHRTRTRTPGELGKHRGRRTH